MNWLALFGMKWIALFGLFAFGELIGFLIGFTMGFERQADLEDNEDD